MFLSFCIDCDLFGRQEIIVPHCVCPGKKNIPRTELMNGGMNVSSNYAYFILNILSQVVLISVKTLQLYFVYLIVSDLEKKLIGKIEVFYNYKYFPNA